MPGIGGHPLVMPTPSDLPPGTWCPACFGTGTRTEPKRAMMLSQPDVHTLITERRCPTCAGSGRLGSPPLNDDTDPPEDDGSH